MSIKIWSRCKISSQHFQRMRCCSVQEIFSLKMSLRKWGCWVRVMSHSTEVGRRVPHGSLKILTLQVPSPCRNLEEILKNYPSPYNKLNPCSRALHSVKTPRSSIYNQSKHCEHPRPAYVGRALRTRAAGRARARALKFSSSFHMLRMDCRWTSKCFDSNLKVTKADLKLILESISW